MMKNDDISRKLSLSLTSNLNFYDILTIWKPSAFQWVVICPLIIFQCGDIATRKIAKFYQFFRKILNK